MGGLEDVRAGPGPARDRWVAAWWPRVYRMALAMTGREADAEDLAQETLAAALGALGRFRGEASEGTWLYAILLRIHRSRARRAALAPAPPRPRDASVEEALALLSRLPASQRITAALFYVEDLSVREIADALGVPRATVRWRLFRARGTLRRSMSGVLQEIL